MTLRFSDETFSLSVRAVLPTPHLSLLRNRVFSISTLWSALPRSWSNTLVYRIVKTEFLKGKCTIKKKNKPLHILARDGIAKYVSVLEIKRGPMFEPPPSSYLRQSRKNYGSPQFNFFLALFCCRTWDTRSAPPHCFSYFFFQRALLINTGDELFAKFPYYSLSVAALPSIRYKI